MDFEKLKSSYILSIQSGLLAGVGYEDIKNANKVINHFCKYYIDAGVSNEAERAEMKHELDMLNNLHLRHNNKVYGDKNYRKVVADMDDSTLEHWYDELYQMILLAFLQLDQVDRNAKILELKQTISSK